MMVIFILPPPFLLVCFKLAQNLDLRCVLPPSTVVGWGPNQNTCVCGLVAGVPTKTRLRPSVNPILCMIRFAESTLVDECLPCIEMACEHRQHNDKLRDEYAKFCSAIRHNCTTLYYYMTVLYVEWG